MPVPKGLVVESAGEISVAGSARRLLVPHGGFFFKSTLKGISGIKALSQRHAGALGYRARRGGQPGVASPWLVVPSE